MAASSRGGPAPALALASVFDADGGVLAQTDGEGRFTLTLSAGPPPLTVGASGHQKLVVTETLAAGTKLEVRYRLERNELTFETVVRARHDEGPSRIELSRVELQEVAGTQGDPFRVTMLLNGVAAIASGLSYPVVRGSQPAATGFFPDGVRLPQLYHLLAGPAVVHPDFIGFEVMIRRQPQGRWFGWLSYTFQRSERFRTVYGFDEHGEVTGASNAWVPFEFDQAHVLHLTGGVPGGASREHPLAAAAGVLVAHHSPVSRSEGALLTFQLKARQCCRRRWAASRIRRECRSAPRCRSASPSPSPAGCTPACSSRLP